MQDYYLRMKPTVRNEEQLFLGYGEAVSIETSRSLDLLRAIDAVLEWAKMEENSLQALINNGHVLVDHVNSPKAEGVLLDSAGVVISNLEKAQDGLIDYHNELQKKLQSACDDPQLTCHDGVEAAYRQICGMVKDLVDVLQLVRDAVAEHDFDVKANPVGDESSILSSDKDIDNFFAGL